MRSCNYGSLSLKKKMVYANKNSINYLTTNLLLHKFEECQNDFYRLI